MLSCINMLLSSVGMSETPIESWGFWMEPEISVCMRVLFEPARVGWFKPTVMTLP